MNSSSEMTQKQNDRRGSVAERRVMPCCDVLQQGDVTLLRLEMPGLAREQVEIVVDNQQLTISALRLPEPPFSDESEAAGSKPRYLLRERSMGRYHRVFNLDETIDGARVTAKMHNGVLTLSLPTKEAAKPKRIEIRTVTTGANSE